jgi:acetyl esterase/lipase
MDRNGVRMRLSPFLITGALAVALGACGARDEVAATTTDTAAVASTISDQNSTEETNTTTTESPVSITDAVPSVQVTVERGLVYREATSDDSGTGRSLVDVYVPDGADTRPAVVLLHGYGEFGSSAELTPLTALAEEIARLGATVFYFKWNTSAGWSAASGDDLACMGSFVAARSSEFGASSDRVVVVGHSMGAEAGSNLAFRSFDLPTKGDCTETGFLPTPKAFLGVGGSYGGIGIPADADQESFLVRGGCSSEPR